MLLRIAGPGARAYAFIIDWHIRLLLALAWLVVASYAASGSLVPRMTGASGLRFVLAVAAPTLIYFLYHPLLEIALRGRTPGKRIAGVRIVNRSGTAPGPGALLIRNLFRIIDSFPLLYGVGFGAVLMTREHCRIGDIAAGTLLVYEDADALDALRAPGDLA